MMVPATAAQNSAPAMAQRTVAEEGGLRTARLKEEEEEEESWSRHLEEEQVLMSAAVVVLSLSCRFPVASLRDVYMPRRRRC
jgi:hypothetical protein